MIKPDHEVRGGGTTKPPIDTEIFLKILNENISRPGRYFTLKSYSLVERVRNICILLYYLFCYCKLNNLIIINELFKPRNNG